MSVFQNSDELKAAVRSTLGGSPNVSTARRRIRAMPGPMLSALPEGAPIPTGMSFDILGEINVIFHEDGSREAMFTIARENDDQNTEFVCVLWTPDPQIS